MKKVIQEIKTSILFKKLIKISLTLIILYLIIDYVKNKKEPVQSSTKQYNDSSQPVPNYKLSEFILEDGKPKYYILIPLVSLNNDNFKNDIKRIINDLVYKKQLEINIEIFDDLKSLKLALQINGHSRRLKKEVNNTDLNDLSRHWIASFNGENYYSNTDRSSLVFFCKGEDDPIVNQYYSSEKFLPATKPKEPEEEIRIVVAENTSERRKELIRQQFSSWDGCHPMLEKMIKHNMNDPDSYEHIETRFADKGNYILVMTKFRGANAYGGKVITSVTAKVNFEGNVLEIME